MRCRQTGSGLGGGVASLFPAPALSALCSLQLIFVQTRELLPTVGLLVLCHIFFNLFKLRIITALLLLVILLSSLLSLSYGRSINLKAIRFYLSWSRSKFFSSNSCL